MVYEFSGDRGTRHRKPAQHSTAQHSTAQHRTAQQNLITAQSIRPFVTGNGLSHEPRDSVNCGPLRLRVESASSALCSTPASTACELRSCRATSSHPSNFRHLTIPRYYARNPTASATQDGHAWSSAMQELLPRALPQLSCSHLAGPPVPLMLA
ncbi:hypothetical protein KC351_g1 [Hortaea werneckii]|nr:hypothetical protein KC351_g1 [Hortaea werneckii]